MQPIQQIEKELREKIIVKIINNDYFIDNFSNVYSRPRHRSNGGIMKQSINKDGYLCVKLVIDGKHKTKRINRLIAESFIDNPFNKTEVNHIDGNKLNNSISNLEWATPSENVSHSYRIGLKKVKSSSGEKYIYLCKNTMKWRVVISLPVGKKYRAGRFHNIQDAIIFRDKLIKEHGLII